MAHYVISMCPFYVRESGKSITCEGLLTEDCFNQTKFHSEDDKKDYQRVYCWRQEWSKCVLAIILNRRYEDG